ncbi:MAG: terpene cyclase/mutase family protein [Planctomycetes bacterium]|nr:terpene cyclase/mutase family protein [Planctomycetota bacterium]
MLTPRILPAPVRRRSILLRAATCALLLAPLAATQTAPTKFGTIFRGEVDGAVAALRAATTAATPGFGDGSVRCNAMALTALGHCHRFYAQGDGPVVRTAIQTLFAGRRADGAFADRTDRSDSDVAATTGWCAEALGVMDPELYRDDVRQAHAWLAHHGQQGPTPWQARLAAVRDAFARGAGTPVDFGRPAATALAETTDRGSAADRAAQVDQLVTVVACQVVARELDAGKVPAPAAAEWSEAQQHGFDFLLAQQKDGVFFVATQGGSFPDTGVSGLALAALQTKPAALRSEAEQKVIDAGLQALLAQQNEDGSFAQRNANYTTCAVILALCAAGRPEFAPALQKAQHYILGIQNVESRGYARQDRDYGSIGYGGDQRGDLSNLHFAIQALRESGVSADDEALAKALVFLQRTQNLRTVNDFSGRVRDDEGEWLDVVSGDDGGAAYYPGNSAAGYVELPDGKRIPRSYGSMTYSLLKCYILCGLKSDDPRVQHAIGWVESNWTLDENPGADPSLDPKTRYQGLFYYYMALAQALDIAGLDHLEVPEADGAPARKVDWRAELRTHLAALQQPDGSWLNDKNGRWWENQKTLCTIYALLALGR